MCGFAGVLEGDGSGDRSGLRDTVAAMADALAHRGPDDAGAWADRQAGIALGFRRLSIIDLSPAGHQPMPSASGRYVIAFNGEVYNAPALRRTLEDEGRAPAFRGHSDTEVMLAAIEAWGLAGAVRRFIGMFAFALWDREERVLSLVRDRLGVKPLYYGWCGDTFVFGSELHALRRHPRFDAEIDRGALALFLRHNYVPAPYTIYRDVWKLPPASALTVRAGEAARPEVYWSARDIVSDGRRALRHLSDADAIDELDALLRDAVRLRMVADVPLGVFLSGGIDSSTVAALMQAESTRPVRTFSIGFGEREFDESANAATVAAHLGTDHTALEVTPRDALDVIPRLAHVYDEPFADSSQVPTLLVCMLARRHVTVALSGDGGDEIFGGYDRYVWMRSFLRAFGWAPTTFRRALGDGIAWIGPERLAGWHGRMAAALPPRLRFRNVAGKLVKLAAMARAGDADGAYLGLMSHTADPASLVLGGHEPPTAFTNPASWPDVDEVEVRAMAIDLISYLPDDILVKVDRASMAVSLEVRAPLLDHRLVELAARLPLDQKMRGRDGKWLLRQVLHRYVPRALVERPKMGFGVPLAAWLRGPLRAWGESLLAESRLRHEGWLVPSAVRQLWSSHVLGRRNHEYLLWNVLMFQAWLGGEAGIAATDAEGARAVAAAGSYASRPYTAV